MGVLQELHLIEDISDRTVHPPSPRGCCLEQPIILSDEEETVIENEVLIPIWVESHPAMDEVVCGQQAVRSYSGVHRSVPSVCCYCHRVDV